MPSSTHQKANAQPPGCWAGAPISIQGRGLRPAQRVAVGTPQYHQSPLAGPTLGHQLLPGVKRKASRPLGRLRPTVEAGPDLANLAARGVGTQEQRTALVGQGHCEHALQNGEGTPINGKSSWRNGGHTDTL